MATKSFDGAILHAAAVRYRLVGSGVFRTKLKSLNEVNEVDLPNITMASATNRMPTILANFNEQMMFVEITTTAIDETFTLDSIRLFITPVATGYPIQA